MRGSGVRASMIARVAVAAVALAVLAGATPAAATPEPVEVGPVRQGNQPTAVSGQANGHLPHWMLSPVSSCEAFVAMAAPLAGMMAEAARAGVPLVAAECYRDYPSQVAARAWRCSLGQCQFAAVPGTSMHGWGKAIDFQDPRTGRAITFDSPAYAWLSANAWRWGFLHPGWAREWAHIPEAWHWEWVGDGGEAEPGWEWGRTGSQRNPPGNPSPFGGAAAWATADQRIAVSGWAIDPDTRRAIDVHTYVGDRGHNLGPATRFRGDVAAVWPGWGAEHGVETTVPSAPGDQRVCTVAIGVVRGGNTALDCAWVRVPGEPFGHVDAVRVWGPGRVRVQGWGIDPSESPYPIDVHVWSASAGVNLGPSRGARPDLVGHHPGAGPSHGFDGTVPARRGTQPVCTYAIDIPSWTPWPFGCTTVTVGGPPRGALDLVQLAPGSTVRVAGWALDPDTDAPVDVHVYQFRGAEVVAGANLGAATRARDDVAAATGWAPARGFDATLASAATATSVCVFAVDRAGGDGATQLGCRAIPVPPLG